MALFPSAVRQIEACWVEVAAGTVSRLAAAGMVDMFVRVRSQVVPTAEGHRRLGMGNKLLAELTVLSPVAEAGSTQPLGKAEALRMAPQRLATGR